MGKKENYIVKERQVTTRVSVMGDITKGKVVRRRGPLRWRMWQVGDGGS